MYEKEHTSVTENAGKPENERLRESLSLQDRADLFLSLNQEAESLGPIEVFEDKYDFVIRDYPLLKSQVLDYIRGKSDKLVVTLPLEMDDDFFIIYFDHLEKYIKAHKYYHDGDQRKLRVVMDQLHEYDPEKTEAFITDFFVSLGDRFEELSSPYSEYLLECIGKYPNVVTHMSTEILQRVRTHQLFDRNAIRVFVVLTELAARGDKDSVALLNRSYEDVVSVEGGHLKQPMIMSALARGDYSVLKQHEDEYYLIMFSVNRYLAFFGSEIGRFSSDFFDVLETLNPDLVLEVADSIFSHYESNGFAIPQRFALFLRTIYLTKLQPGEDLKYAGSYNLMQTSRLNRPLRKMIIEDHELFSAYMIALTHQANPDSCHSAFEGIHQFLREGAGYERIATSFLSKLGFSERSQYECHFSFFEQELVANTASYFELVAEMEKIYGEEKCSKMLFLILENQPTAKDWYIQYPGILKDVVRRNFKALEAPSNGEVTAIMKAVKAAIASQDDFCTLVTQQADLVFKKIDPKNDRRSFSEKRQDNTKTSLEIYLDENPDATISAAKKVDRTYLREERGFNLLERALVFEELVLSGYRDSELLSRYDNYLAFKELFFDYRIVHQVKDIDAVWSASKAKVIEVIAIEGVGEEIIKLLLELRFADGTEWLVENVPVWFEAILDTGSKDILALFRKTQHLRSRNVWNFVSSTFSHAEIAEFLANPPTEKGTAFDRFFSGIQSEAMVPLFTVFLEAETKSVPATEKNAEQQQRIKELEERMGITSDMGRFRESTLCINTDLLAAHSFASAGDVVTADRLYGDEYWEQWLRGRIFLDDHKDDALSMNLLDGLYDAVSPSESYANDIRSSVVINPVERQITHDELYRLQSSGKLFFLEVGEQPKLELGQNARNHKGIIIYPTVYSLDSLLLRYPQFAGSEISEQAKRDYSAWQSNLLEMYEKDGVPASSHKQLLTSMLEELIRWYSDNLAHPDVRPYRLAQDLQRRFAEIHPLEDKNGRISRLLMNWSLAKSGKSPAFVGNEEEFFISIFEQRRLMQVASEQHQMLVAIQQELSGMDSSIAFLRVLFNEDEDRGFVTFQREMYARSFDLIRSCFKVEMTEKEQEIFRKFFVDLKAEYDEFTRESIFKYSYNRVNNEDFPFFETEEGYQILDVPKFLARQSEQGHYTLLQDAFCPIELDSITTRPDRLQLSTTFAGRELVRRLYLTEERMFKGGYFVRSKSPLNDVDSFLKMFTQAVGAGSSYMTVDESGITTGSFEPVTPNAFLLGQINYNSALRRQVMAKKFAHQNKRAAGDTELKRDQEKHIDWNSGEGPSYYTSFAARLRPAFTYSQGLLGDRLGTNLGRQYNFLIEKFGLTKGQLSDLYGMVIEAAIPKEGCHQTGNVDDEILVAGGILPESVMALLIYDISTETTLYAATDPQVKLNDKYYGVGDSRSVTGADPKPIGKPIMEFRSHKTAENEFVVLTDFRNGNEKQTVFGLCNGSFVRVSPDYAKEILPQLLQQKS